MARFSLTRVAALACAVFGIALAACNPTTDIDSPTSSTLDPVVIPDHLPAGTIAVAPAAPVVGSLRTVLAEGVPNLPIRPATDIDPPAGAEFVLDSCEFIGPSTYVYGFTAGGDVAYPYVTTLGASRGSGDQFWGFSADVEIPGPGRHRIVESQVDLADDDWDVWLEKNPVVGNRVGREHHSRGATCMLGAPGPRASVPLEDRPQSLELTAPLGSVDRIGQMAFTGGSDALLAPAASAYGDPLKWYSESWFIPSEPEPLLSIRQDLSDSGCLEMTFVYETYFIVQQLGCRAVEAEAVYQAGRLWVAHASDGENPTARSRRRPSRCAG